MSDLMNHEAVYRTAPATPSMLKNSTPPPQKKKQLLRRSKIGEGGVRGRYDSGKIFNDVFLRPPEACLLHGI